MIEIFFRYRVHPSQAMAFEHAYGQNGPWVKLFSQKAGYRRSRLFRHKSEPGVYVTVDIWDTKGLYDAFRAEYAFDYARIDRELQMLKLEELLLGYYEGEDEYRAPSEA